MITDTLAYKEKLEAGGFSADQAKALIEANRDHVVDLATKEDLRLTKEELQREIKAVQNRFEVHEQRIETVLQKNQTENLRNMILVVGFAAAAVTLITKVF